VTVADHAFYAALVEDDAEELYENAPCAYLSLLPDGTIAKVNGTFTAWTGHARDDVLGCRFQDLLAPGDRIFYETHVAPMLRMQGLVREIAVDVVCSPSAARLPVLMNAAMKVDGASGEALIVRAVLFDATERRRYERELVAARERAEASEQRATALARTLQESFLPAAMPDMPGFDVAGAYRPAGDGSEVGGDFYDVFSAGGDRWALVLGDVCGKGAGAAVLTALARYTVRAEVARSPRPSDVLGGLHAALLRSHPDRFCTAVLAIAERTASGAALTLASGGHQLPLLARADGTVGALGVTGTIVGMLDTPDVVDSRGELSPGDVVVMYTDGVTEARHDGDFYGIDRLRSLVASAREADAQTVAERVVGDALAFQDGDAADDIAVLVLKVR
jgi:sigma-B regulation protein RsbU (phosphoserine phosphatase)